MLRALYCQRVTLQNTGVRPTAYQLERSGLELLAYTAPLLPIQRLHSSRDGLSVPVGVIIGDAPE
jgi:hypothetical protein